MRVEGKSERSELYSPICVSRAKASFTRLYAYMLVFPAEGTADYECKGKITDPHTKAFNNLNIPCRRHRGL